MHPSIYGSTAYVMFILCWCGVLTSTWFSGVVRLLFLIYLALGVSGLCDGRAKLTDTICGASCGCGCSYADTTLICSGGPPFTVSLPSNERRCDWVIRASAHHWWWRPRVQTRLIRGILQKLTVHPTGNGHLVLFRAEGGEGREGEEWRPTSVTSSAIQAGCLNSSFPAWPCIGWATT